MIYKGKGEHSVRGLETIIEILQEQLHVFNSSQKVYTEKDMDNAYDKGYQDGLTNNKKQDEN